MRATISSGCIQRGGRSAEGERMSPLDMRGGGGVERDCAGPDLVAEEHRGRAGVGVELVQLGGDAGVELFVARTSPRARRSRR